MRSFLALLALLAPCSGCGDLAEPASDGDPTAPDVRPSREEVLAACSDFAIALCQSASDCCAATSGATVESCTERFVTDVCRPGADAVAAGFATYHPESEAACLAAHARSHEACFADWPELLELRRGIWRDCRVIQGAVQPGRGCTTALTCAAPEGGVARCEAGHCAVVELLGEGAVCPYPNGDVSVCDAGSYCTTTELDVEGVCMPVTALGAACAPFAGNPECGLGNYCDLDDAVCRAADKSGGAACEQGGECLSFSCSANNGTCRDQLPTVAALCPAE